MRSKDVNQHLPEYASRLIPTARVLRKRMTNVERKIWSLLRKNQLGVKFRRQFPIGNYIIDFCCQKAKLAVELDGGQHYTIQGRIADHERDKYLSVLGIKVKGYSDREALQNTTEVIREIFECVKARTSSKESFAKSETTLP